MRSTKTPGKTPRTTSLRSTPLQRLIVVEMIAGHQSGRRRDVVIAVMYETHLIGFSRTSWERAMDLQLFPTSSFFFGPPNQRCIGGYEMALHGRKDLEVLRRAISGVRLGLRPAHGLGSPLQHHGDGSQCTLGTRAATVYYGGLGKLARVHMLLLLSLLLSH